MKHIFALIIAITSSLTLNANGVNNLNQTTALSPIHPGAELPFTIRIEQAGFSLPNGFHSGVSAVYQGHWLFLAGRTNGLHGFSNDDNNFPPQKQNTTVFVIDPKTETVHTRDLTDSGSGLSQVQIDSLSATSSQFYQSKNTLYITGGYGYNSETDSFGTWDKLTAINVPGLIHWVVNPSVGESAAEHIRQISDPLFKVTGGLMAQAGKKKTLLIFGQNFEGYYNTESNGNYVQQVRRFRIHDDCENLSVDFKEPKPEEQDPVYRRRDLNIVPCIKYVWGMPVPYFVALSGVFTVEGGIWTIPVEITADGKPSMASPTSEETFKQGMNNYICPSVGLYNKNNKNMYTILFGGISYGYFQNGVFQTDSEIPFINQVTTIRIDGHGKYKQYLMANEYPVIYSTQSNPGNQLLFGAGATFIEAEGLPMHDNTVIKMEKLKKDSPRLLGYIVGGIQSTLPNTNTMSDSAASPYIFKVTYVP